MNERGRFRVMLVEDHPLVRDAVRRAIEGPDLAVVAEVGSAEEALELAPRLRPDLLLADIDLPGMSGVQLVRELAPRVPQTKIVMLTVSHHDRDVVDAITHGAAGYLTKDLTPDALRRAALAACRGDLAIPRRIAAGLIRDLVARARRAPLAGGDPAFAALSEREVEVLRLLASGRTDREIADALGISVRTINSHVGSILHKLGVRNRAEAAQRYRALA